MVEPVTLTAAAIATMMATKAFEKTGEKVGEGVWGLVSKFLAALKHKDPATAGAIETVALAEQPQPYLSFFRFVYFNDSKRLCRSGF